MIDDFDEVTGELLPDLDVDVTPRTVGVNEATVVPFVRSPYNYDRDAVSFQTGLFCDDPSLTQQHMADDADINVIVKRFGITGQMPSGVRLPTYGDFTGVGDYRSALEAVRDADDAFMELPADIRTRFDNDPQRYLDFAENPANQEEIYNLGLATRPSGSNPSPIDSPKANNSPDSGGAVPATPSP